MSDLDYANSFCLPVLGQLWVSDPMNDHYHPDPDVVRVIRGVFCLECNAQVDSFTVMTLPRRVQVGNVSVVVSFWEGDRPYTSDSVVVRREGSEGASVTLWPEKATPDMIHKASVAASLL